MSWDCPYLKNDICELNKYECKPALGNCILRDKAIPVSRLKNKKNSKENSGNKGGKNKDRI
jgi:hypothetical protein